MPKKTHSKPVLDLLQSAAREAMIYEHSHIYPQHFLLCMLNLDQGIALRILDKLKADAPKLKEDLIENISTLEKVKYNEYKVDKIPPSEEMKKILQEAYNISDELNTPSVTTECVMVAMVIVNSVVKDLLSNHGITLPKIKGIAQQMRDETGKKIQSMDRDLVAAGQNVRQKQNKGSILRSFCRDLNSLVREGKVGKIVGREKELNRVINILSRLTKNNPMILGESGVGKTALLEGLAWRIVEKKVPSQLKNKKIFLLDLGSLVAGTKYRGQFEERLKDLLKEVENDEDIILAIDELHTIISAGSAEGTLDAANMLKEPLARGHLRCIGLTTFDEYTKYVESDTALSRRFNIVKVDPPNPEQTLEILKGVCPRFSKYHSINIDEDVMKYIVVLCEKYIHGKNFPDKAIDVLDEACSRKKLEAVPPSDKLKEIEEKIAKIEEKISKYRSEGKYDRCEIEQIKREKLYQQYEQEEASYLDLVGVEFRTISSKDISDVIFEMTGIPISDIDKSDEIVDYKNVQKDLLYYIKGQDDAVKSVCSSVLKGRLGLKDKNKPIATLLFAGPTGVGKTEVARKIAKILFGDEKFLIREDMSNYSESYSTSKLIGCFIRGSIVNTKDRGNIPIEDVNIGDIVLTHLNRHQRVNNKYVYGNDSDTQVLKKVRFLDFNKSVREIICTPEHEFYVLRTSNNNSIPEWIAAKDLKTTDILLSPISLNNGLKSSAIDIITGLKIVSYAISIIGSIYGLVNKIILNKKKNNFTYDASQYLFSSMISITDYTYTGQVYDLGVENDTSYVVNGVAVHNSSPGYVGFDSGGGLTNKVKHNPYSVVLLDEIEKADSAVWNLLLPLLEEGRLVDSKTNRPIDFKNTVIILTTNLGSQIGDIPSIGINNHDNKESKELSDYKDLKKKTTKKIKDTMNPEFINRLDDIVVFKSLNKDSIRDILNLTVELRNKDFESTHNFTLRINEDLKDKIIENGYSPKFGARELKRTFEKMVIDPLVEYYMDNSKDVKNSVIVCGLDKNNEVKFSVKKK